ncbi:MAG TPA: TetR/AcrR family transcriptional regulator [Actinocrinis sp.]|nr:TetR/AcrR family transcriptional regulator [Actinocrinis sp.]
MPKRDTYTTESLLSVAVGVFNLRGYDGTSMEDLAKAAGISKSSIYHHVAGKEELLRLAVTRALDGLFAVLDEPTLTDLGAAGQLAHVLEHTCQELVRNLPYVTLLLRVRGNSETERAALARRREFDHRVAELVRAAVEEGDLRPDLDPRLTARLIFGLVNSVSEWYRPDQDDPGADGAPSGGKEIADALSTLVFEGLRRRD